MIPPKIILAGDESRAKLFIGLAKDQLAILEKQMSFQDLNEGTRKVQPFDDLFIEVYVSFSIRVIKIFAPLRPEVAEEKAGEQVLEHSGELFIFAKAGLDVTPVVMSMKCDNLATCQFQFNPANPDVIPTSAGHFGTSQVRYYYVDEETGETLVASLFHFTNAVNRENANFLLPFAGHVDIAEQNWPQYIHDYALYGEASKRVEDGEVVEYYPIPSTGIYGGGIEAASGVAALDIATKTIYQASYTYEGVGNFNLRDYIGFTKRQVINGAWEVLIQKLEPWEEGVGLSLFDFSVDKYGFFWGALLLSTTPPENALDCPGNNGAWPSQTFESEVSVANEEWYGRYERLDRGANAFITFYKYDINAETFVGAAYTTPDGAFRSGHTAGCVVSPYNPNQVSDFVIVHTDDGNDVNLTAFYNPTVEVSGDGWLEGTSGTFIWDQTEPVGYSYRFNYLIGDQVVMSEYPRATEADRIRHWQVYHDGDQSYFTNSGNYSDHYYQSLCFAKYRIPCSVLYVQIKGGFDVDANVRIETQELLCGNYQGLKEDRNWFDVFTGYYSPWWVFDQPESVCGPPVPRPWPTYDPRWTAVDSYYTFGPYDAPCDEEYPFSIHYSELSYPEQITVLYPIRIEGVHEVLNTFVTHDQEHNITFCGVKYSTVDNLRYPEQGDVHINWKITVSTPYIQDFDITDQVKEAFGRTIENSGGEIDYSLFYDDFKFIYFYRWKNLQVNKITIPA